MLARLLSAALLLTIVVPLCAGEHPPTWRAGAAKVKITPEELMWMSGYGGRNKPAERTLIDLWAKALVIEDPQGKQLMLITADLVGIDRELSVQVCKEIGEKCKLPRESISLALSHTHTGPVVGSNLNAMYTVDEKQQKLIADYSKFLHRNLVAVARDAVKNLAPAQLTWGNGRVTFAVNRRTNKESDVVNLREAGQLKGPVDHDVPVLVVRDKDLKVQAVVCGYACHATVLDFYQWSGDWPGFAQIELEKAFPGAVALFFAGCGADQNPLPRRTVAHAENYGAELAAGVRAVIKGPMSPISGSLSAVYREIDLPFGDLPTREDLVKDAEGTDKYRSTRAKLLLKQIEEKGSLRGTYPYPVQTWQLGSDLTLVALGGEVVVDYSLRLKKELGANNLWVAGYCNDIMAYIPSLRVLKEGGYEGGGSMVYYGLPTVWGTKVEELIVESVHEQVKKVRGGK